MDIIIFGTAFAILFDGILSEPDMPDTDDPFNPIDTGGDPFDY